MELKTSPEVQSVFDKYPEFVRGQMLELREIILTTAAQIEGITTLEETLKWGEPSYLAKGGSTLRMDWKAKNPKQYALYFKCTSRLVETFRAVYPDQLKFETNRAVVFDLEQPLPVKAITNCIRATLRYHKVKHLPYLGLK